MEILASMPIHRYWTTNYDSIIEDTLEKHEKITDVITDQRQFKYHSPERDAVVFKMHGDKTLPDNAVLSKNDYENYDESRLIFTQSLMIDLISNTFLFIGFSFSDPNLDRIIAIVKRNLKGATLKKHYCFMRSICLNDYLKNGVDNSKAKEQFIQDSNAQACKIKDMRRYGIETILVDDFNQITQMLKYMSDKIKLNSVFVSGGTSPEAPFEYGEFQKQEKGKLGKAENFMMRLADELIIKGYNLVTGFGVGVGNYIVAGAYTRKEEKNAIKLDEKIHIQPMISLEDNTSNVKNEIRKELLEKCGVVITIFGKSDDEVEDEQLEKDGTFIEYTIAKKSGKIIIPVGATGFTSRIIYNKEKNEWKGNTTLYAKLGNKKIDNETLIKSIIDGIEYRKKKQEDNMREVLVKNLFETASARKKVFISFHYSSSYECAEKIIDIIQKNDNYCISKELEKCEEPQIQQWIDEKMRDAVATIVIFNKEFSKRKWTDYEVQRSVEKNIPLLFLMNEEDNLSDELEKYIKQKKIKHQKNFKWKNEKELQQLPRLLDELIGEYSKG